MTAHITDEGSPDRRGHDWSFGAGLAAAVVVLIVLAWPLLCGKIYAWGDLADLHLPLRQFYARCLARGDSFIWIPDIFCGFFLHGEGQVGMYHPLHLWLYGALPLEVGFNLEMLLSYPALLAGMYLLLRRWQLSRAAATFGALVFAFSGFNLMHYMHLNVIAGIAHYPWLLLAIDCAWREEAARRRAFALLGIALLTASEVILSHPQFIWYSLLLEGLYLLLLLVTQRDRLGRLPELAAAKCAGVLLGGIQLVPTLDMLSHSVRHDPELAFRYLFSLHPVNLLQPVAPYLFGERTRYYGEGNNEEFALYNGAAAWLLFLLVLWRWRRLQTHRSLALWAVMIGVAALVLALGKYGYAYRILARLPLLGWFRCACRHILFVHFATGITAAVALDVILRKRLAGAWPSWRELRPLWATAVASVFIAGGAICVKMSGVAWPTAAEVVGPVRYLIAGSAVVVISACLLALTCVNPRWAVALILFSTFDQAAYGLTWVKRLPATTVAELAAQVPKPPGPVQGRVVYPAGWGNRPLLIGMRMPFGFASLQPARQLDVESEAFVQLACAEWIYDESGSVPRWHHIPNPVPRVRLVTRAIACERPAERLATKTVDIRTMALVFENLELADGEPGQATILTYRPGHIRVATSTNTAQLLVLSESYHPGWRACSDGMPVRVMPVYGDFLACLIDAGQHEVEFVFRPQSLRLGTWCSLAGAGLTVITCVVVWWRARRPRIPQDATQATL